MHLFAAFKQNQKAFKNTLQTLYNNMPTCKISLCVYTYMYFIMYAFMYVCMYVCMYSLNHSFIPAISIAPLQVLYYSEALPTTAQILYRSFTPKGTGNCK